MLKVPVNEIFMYYFQNMPSVSGSFAPKHPPGLRSWTPLGESRHPDFLICPPLVKILRAPMLVICVGKYPLVDIGPTIVLCHCVIW